MGVFLQKLRTGLSSLPGAVAIPNTCFGLCLLGMTCLMGETTVSAKEPLVCWKFPPGSASLKGEAQLRSPNLVGESGLSRKAVLSVSVVF